MCGSAFSHVMMLVALLVEDQDGDKDDDVPSVEYQMN